MIASAQASTVLRTAANFLQHWALDRRDRWDPIIAVYYLTYRCKFRCPYCSDGAQSPYYRLKASPLSAERALDLLRVIRSKVDYLILTGGEPTEHPELGRVLAGLPALRYRGVVFTTNGYDLEPHLPLPRGAVSDLVFSLDTLDPAKADAWFGVGSGALRRILRTIDLAAAQLARDYEIVISTVVTPESLDDVDEVYAYARERGFRLAACPQLVGVKAHPALAPDPRYRRFYEALIAEKRAGRAVHGTVRYLEAMRDLRHFPCRPFTMLVASPEGDVFYPCLEIGKLAGNLLETDDLHALREEGERRFGPQPRCDTRCHSACALGFATLLEDPLGELTSEGMLLAKAALRRGLTRSGR